LQKINAFRCILEVGDVQCGFGDIGNAPIQMSDVRPIRAHPNHQGATHPYVDMLFVRFYIESKRLNANVTAILVTQAMISQSANISLLCPMLRKAA
jgi:hypothetical protein